MEKLTDLISKNIYCLSSGQKIGFILNVNFDEDYKKIKSLIFVDDESGEEGLVDANCVLLGGENVFVKSAQDLIYGAPLENASPIGKLVFTDVGGECGRVKEVFLNKFRAESFISDKLAFSSKQISFVGQDAVILGKRKKKGNFFKRQLLSEHPTNETLVSITALPAQKELPSMPFRISSDPKNLIGKMATKDIFGLNNELIIKKFEIITQKKINEIKKHNKLNILFYNCK